MPHKRNPVAAMLALAAAQRAPLRVAALLATMAQEHERGLGNWQAELAEWAQLFGAAHGGLKALADAAALGLEVDAARMRENIERLHGLVYAEAVSARLAATLGKSRAHALVEDWSRSVAREGARCARSPRPRWRPTTTAGASSPRPTGRRCSMPSGRPNRRGGCAAAQLDALRAALARRSRSARRLKEGTACPAPTTSTAAS